MGMYKQALFKHATTPHGERPVPERSSERFDVDTLIRSELTKHYAKLLAAAMRRAGAPQEWVDHAQDFVSPSYSYAIGRAVDIHPELLSALRPEDRKALSGWNFHATNISPAMLRNAVGASNHAGRGHQPLNEHSGTETGPELELKEKI